MKLAYILFLQICLLIIPNSYSSCIVKRINTQTATESVPEVLTPNKTKVNKSLLDFPKLKFVLLENTSETEKHNSSFPLTQLNLNVIGLRDNCSVYREILNSQGLLERNIIPFSNTSRNIIFHSLKIHI